MKRPTCMATAFALLLVIATLAAAGRVWAGDATPTAGELRRRGDEAMDAARAAEALEAYRAAAAMEPSAVLDYDIGRALLATGDFAGALASFESFQRVAPDELKARTHRLDEIMRELEEKVATLEVSGTPVGAQVRVRGAEVGVLPLVVRVNAGPAEIRVVKAGYEAFVETRELPGRATARVAIALAAERTAGRPSIFARPANAAITIDGRSQGSSPVAVSLPPGAHELAIEASAHRRQRITINLVRDEVRRVDVVLDREATPLSKSPWFWAGIGVLAAGAVVTVVALTQTRSPDEGSLGTFRVP